MKQLSYLPYAFNKNSPHVLAYMSKSDQISLKFCQFQFNEGVCVCVCVLLCVTYAFYNIFFLFTSKLLVFPLSLINNGLTKRWRKNKLISFFGQAYGNIGVTRGLLNKTEVIERLFGYRVRYRRITWEPIQTCHPVSFNSLVAHTVWAHRLNRRKIDPLLYFDYCFLSPIQIPKYDCKITAHSISRYKAIKSECLAPLTFERFKNTLKFEDRVITFLVLPKPILILALRRCQAVQSCPMNPPMRICCPMIWGNQFDDEQTVKYTWWSSSAFFWITKAMFLSYNFIIFFLIFENLIKFGYKILLQILSSKTILHLHALLIIIFVQNNATWHFFIVIYLIFYFKSLRGVSCKAW